MKQSIMCYVVSAFMATVSAAAMADVPEKKVLDHVPAGVYVEGTLGYSYTGAGFSNQASYDPHGYAGTQMFSTTDLSNGGLGYNVSIGYQFLNNIGIEVGATQYASKSGTVDMGYKPSHDSYQTRSNVGSVEINNSRMYDVAGRFSMPVGESSDVFAKVGLAYLTRDVSYSENDYPVSDLAGESSDHGLGVLYGVGFDYNFTEHTAWTTSAVAATPFSYFGDHSDHPVNDPTTPNMFLVSTGLKYTF
jgi:opacity protein-like surface antigen